MKFKLKSGAKIVAIISLITELVTVCSMPAFAMKRKTTVEKCSKKTLRLSIYRRDLPEVIINLDQPEPLKQIKKKSFKQEWRRICPNTSNTPIISIKNNIFYQPGPIANLVRSIDDIPQENFILSDNSTIYIELSWSYYIPMSEIGTNNLYDLAHGILFFITYYSENKFNRAELEFFCTGNNKYLNLGTLKQCPNWEDYDVLNILPDTYTALNKYLTVDSDIIHPNPVFGFRFKRVKVNPIGYAVRCGARQNQASPASIRLWGIKEDGTKVLLHETININDLLRPGGYAFFYCRTTDKYFDTYAVEMFDPNNGQPYPSFSIVFFEIHGNVLLKNSKSQLLLSLDKDQIDPKKDDGCLLYNPCADISLHLY